MAPIARIERVRSDRLRLDEASDALKERRFNLVVLDHDVSEPGLLAKETTGMNVIQLAEFTHPRELLKLVNRALSDQSGLDAAIATK